MIPQEVQHARQRLTGLGLGAEDLESLRSQGFVNPEFRYRSGRRWGPYYKLRWRQNGRQRVLYLGADEIAVSRIRKALEVWQQPVRLAKEAENLLRQTRTALKSLRDLLTPQISEDGRIWHGYGSRRPRNPDIKSATEESNETDSLLESSLS